MKHDNPDHMRLWNLLYSTDPSAVKPITGKQYQGNSPRPYWVVEKATSVLGPCGIGWGVEVVNERFERLTDDDVLHVALVRVWYRLDENRGVIEQMGQTKAVYKTSSGKVMVDEDAPKKSVTDGMVKCLSLIGVAGDIFSGRWDDSKYVAEQGDRERNEKPASTNQQYQQSISGIKKSVDNINDKYKPQTVPSNLTISDEQFKELNALMDEVGADKVAFCEYFNIQSVSGLLDSDFNKAKAMINKKRQGEKK